MNIYGLRLLSRESNSIKGYYRYNYRGDVLYVMDRAGSKDLARYKYDLYGRIIEEHGDFDNPFRYKGYIYDSDANYYYLNARMYDPTNARFLQEDTYLGDPKDPLSLNRYTYCINNPVKYYDPTGHFPIVLFAIGAAVFGGVVSTVIDIKRQKLHGEVNYYQATQKGVTTAFTIAALSCIAIEAGAYLSAYTALGTIIIGGSSPKGYSPPTGGSQGGSASNTNKTNATKASNTINKTAISQSSKNSHVSSYKAENKVSVNIKNNINTPTVKERQLLSTKMTTTNAKPVNIKGITQADFYVSPKGDVIPATKEGFNSNLSQMKEVSGKYTGEGGNGPVRVRVEDAHPRDPDFIGHVSPDHYVPHVHIEYRVNGKTGPWGVGGNKISFPQEWLK